MDAEGICPLNTIEYEKHILRRCNANLVEQKLMKRNNMETDY